MATTIEAPSETMTQDNAAVIAHQGVNPFANQRLVSLRVKISNPSFRPVLRGATVQSEGVLIEESKRTMPGLKIDAFPPIIAINKNRDKINKMLDVYSANDHQPGFHLVPFNSLSRCLTLLVDLIEQRKQLVNELDAQWSDYQDWLMDNFTSDIAKVQNYLKASNLEPGRLQDKFAVSFGWFEFSGDSNLDNLHLQDLSPESAAKVRSEVEAQVIEKAKERAQRLFDQVFGEVATLCDELLDSEKAFGRKQEGSLESWMRMLERVKTFSSFTTSDVLERVTQAQSLIGKVTHQQVNHDPFVQSQLRNALTPLRASLKQFVDSTKPGGGRTRTVRV